jgi:hypothetical protein
MTQISIPDQTLSFVDADGNVILEASLLDIHAYTSLKLVEMGVKTIDTDEPIPHDHFINQLKTLVPMFNAEFHCNLTWGQLEYILREVNKLQDDLKKN